MLKDSPNFHLGLKMESYTHVLNDSDPTPVRGVMRHFNSTIYAKLAACQT